MAVFHSEYMVGFLRHTLIVRNDNYSISILMGKLFKKLHNLFFIFITFSFIRLFI